MKRLVSLFLLAVMLIAAISSWSITSAAADAAQTYVPSRTINLVYDDSGSMIHIPELGYLDTWCQAKYAMEVFAAMLGEKDTLNIYYMSDYSEDTSAPPKLTLKGSKDAVVTEENVKKIHNLITFDANTPINSMFKAAEDLKSATTDEKWLVVLTDGLFDDGVAGVPNTVVENHVYDYVSDGVTKVIMFSMGSYAAEITSDADKGIFTYKSNDNSEIPGTLTDICSRIFQNNKLPIDTGKMSASFEVPMGQLIVFAQGKNVEIGNITDSEGNSFKPDSNVEVKYSDTATTSNYYRTEEIKVADNLMGHVATYDAQFDPDTYKFDIEGADTVEVYYKPNVSIEAHLYNEENQDVTKEAKLVAGTYRLDFGFTNAENGESVTNTDLLGDIYYECSIKNTLADGTVNEFTAEIGDLITIEEGSLSIDVTAQFLDYNTVKANLSYEIFTLSELIFTFDNIPGYTLTTNGFTDGDKPIELSVKIQSGEEVKDLTEDQLELLGIPKVTTDGEDIGPLRIEKADEPGKFYIYPTLKDDDPMETYGGTYSFRASGEFTQEKLWVAGSAENEFIVNDKISSTDRFIDWMKKYGPTLAICLLIFFLILGYIPPFKKYLPRRLSKRPLIRCRAERIGLQDREVHGKYKKNTITTFIPYKAETGVLVFSPSPAKQTAKIKAAKGRAFNITNTAKFAGKSNIVFGNMPMEEGRTKPYRMSPVSTITVKTTDYTYTCHLNV